MPTNLIVTPEMRRAAKEVLELPQFRPGVSLPYFMQREAQLLEFARVMADAILGTDTPPLAIEPASKPKFRAPTLPQPKKGQLTEEGPVDLPTAPQLEALKRMPQEWFFPELLASAIHSADIMCQRLVARGILELRTIQEHETKATDEPLAQWLARIPHTHQREYRLTAWGKYILARRQGGSFFIGKNYSPWAQDTLTEYLASTQCPESISITT